MTSFKTYLLLGILFFFGTSVKSQDSIFFKTKEDTTTFVQIIQNPNINIINDEFKSKNSGKTIVDGFRIQIYYGSRPKAYNNRMKFIEKFPEIMASLIYEEPNFKTVVGAYFTKLDADRDLQKIKEEFRDAFIIKNRIEKK